VFPLIVNKQDIYVLCKFTFLFLALNLQIFIKVKVPFAVDQLHEASDVVLLRSREYQQDL
jgi:hypothetical protein